MKKTTEKLFLHTIYSVSRLTDTLYFVLIYTQKGLFQRPSYRGEGILATVVKSWRFDSLTTPTILCSIAKEIGGFDKISNLYYDGSWNEHWYARVTIGNQSKDYTFCPDVSTGDIGEIQKINFLDTSKMTKIY